MFSPILCCGGMSFETIWKWFLRKEMLKKQQSSTIKAVFHIGREKQSFIANVD